MKKSRIAFFFNHSFFLGGGEVSFYELIRAIDKTKFQPVVIVPDKGEIEREFNENNVKVIANPLPPLKHIVFGSPVFAILKLTRIVKKYRVDIIHANGSRASFYSGIAGRMAGIPVIWHVRETLRDLYFYDGLLGSLANNIICVSNSVRMKRFSRFGSVIINKTSVVYNGVDTFKFMKNEGARRALRNRYSIKENEILFGIIGNIIPRKGQNFFLRGLYEAKKRKPDLLAKALIIGRQLDSNFASILHRLVIERGLEDCVIFRNFIKEIADIYSSIDVLVLPSKSEGFSRSLIEAMSSGLPVLAAKVSEIEEAVIDRENAILVNFDDIENMASAIIALSEDEKLRENMGENNRKRSIDLFDLKLHTESIQKIYTSLLSDNL